MKENVMTAKTTTLALVVTAVAFGTMAFTLVIFGHDGTEFDKFKDFLVWLVPLTVGQLFLSRQNNEIRSKLNGNLDAKFDALHERFTTLENRIGALEKSVPTESAIPESEIPE